MSEDRYLFLIYYLVVTAVLIPIIIGLTRGRTKAWYKKSATFYTLTNGVTIVTLVVSTAVLYQQLFIPEKTWDKLFNGTLLGALTFFLAYLLFLLASLGITFAGIKSIKEKDTLAILPTTAPHGRVKGNEAVLNGLIYLGIGAAFLWGVLQVGALFLT